MYPPFFAKNKQLLSKDSLQSAYDGAILSYKSKPHSNFFVAIRSHFLGFHFNSQLILIRFQLKIPILIFMRNFLVSMLMLHVFFGKTCYAIAQCALQDIKYSLKLKKKEVNWVCFPDKLKTFFIYLIFKCWNKIHRNHTTTYRWQYPNQLWKHHKTTIFWNNHNLETLLTEYYSNYIRWNKLHAKLSTSTNHIIYNIKLFTI